MKFYEALKLCVEDGKKIRRHYFLSGAYLVLTDGLLRYKGVNIDEAYRPSAESFMADDWEVVKEPRKFKETRWVNLYPDGRVGGTFQSQKEALNCRLPSNSKCEQRKITLEWEVDEEDE